jgi:iron complex transport system ATP-binding protein
MNSTDCLQASDIEVRLGGATRLRQVSLRLPPGELHALLGPNGAGKTTLLRVMAGDLRPDGGSVQLNDRELNRFSARALARCRAVLPQTDHLQFAFSARDVVALGRFAAVDQGPRQEAAIVEEALTAAGVLHLADRPYPELSGGERARVRFARVMAQLWVADAQASRYLLLDEPTAALDLAHQHACMAMATCLAAGGIGVLAILHDPNLAMRYAHRVTLLSEGRAVTSGAPEEVLSAERLSAVYGVPVAVDRLPSSDRPIIVVNPALRGG